MCLVDLSRLPNVEHSLVRRSQCRSHLTAVGVSSLLLLSLSALEAQVESIAVCTSYHL